MCVYCKHHGGYLIWDDRVGEVDICGCCLADYVDDFLYQQKLKDECRTYNQ